MPILLIDVFRALWALRRDAGFVSLGILLVVAIAGGGVVYWRVEDLAPLDAVYLSVITLTTVGYGDPAPATGVGKAFTAAFVLLGMGILLAFLSAMAAQIRRHSLLRAPLGRVNAKHDAQSAPKAAVGEMRTVAALAGIADYDLLVIGFDETSRRTALEAAQAGLRVVIVEPDYALRQAA
jgi:hypothetical protein